MKPFPLIPITALTIAACGSHDDPARRRERAPVPVAVAVARTEALAGTFEAGGSVRARTVAVLASRILAPVIEVRVAAGDRVRGGEPLVLLDARELQTSAVRAVASLDAARQNATAAAAEARAAEAAVVLASATHKRMAGLRERNAATPAELDAAVAALDEARARAAGSSARVVESQRAIDAAEAGARGAAVARSYATLNAPFDGVVTMRSVDAGNLASPGMPLLTIEDVRHFRIEVGVDASRAASISSGMHVPVMIDGLDGSLDGVVAETAQSVDPISHIFTVKIDLPGVAHLRSGLFGRARFAGAPVPGLAVPATAVVRRGQLALVFVEDQGVARMRLVHTGAETNGRIAVFAGIMDGDRVIVSPPADLVDGSPVTPSGEGRPR